MFALILLTSLCADPEPDASRLAVIRTAPEFTLTTRPPSRCGPRTCTARWCW